MTLKKALRKMSVGGVRPGDVLMEPGTFQGYTVTGLARSTCNGKPEIPLADGESLSLPTWDMTVDIA